MAAGTLLTETASHQSLGDGKPGKVRRELDDEENGFDSLVLGAVQLAIDSTT